MFFVFILSTPSSLLDIDDFVSVQQDKHFSPFMGYTPKWIETMHIVEEKRKRKKTISKCLFFLSVFRLLNVTLLCVHKYAQDV